MDDFDQFKVTYFAECSELLSDVETQLSELSSGSSDPEVLHAIFRAVHTIKAGAGAFKFTQLAEFSHEFEALLDRMRTGKIAVTEDGVSLLFRAADILAAMVESAENEETLSEDFGRQVLDEILKIVKGGAAPQPSTPSPTETADEPEDKPEGKTAYKIIFAPKAELFKHANEPLLIVRELKTLGTLTSTASLEKLPALKAMDGEEAYISWIFHLTTEASLDDVEEVFEFVTEDCDLSIEAVEADLEEQTSVEDEKQTDQQPEKVSSQQNTPTATVPAASKGAAKVSSIRVDLDRIDRLVNMVGELVITQSMLSQQTNDLPTEKMPNMIRGLEELALHTRELQESVMAIRMQPVKSVFSRIPRLVRDLSNKLNKKVVLNTVGENTEVDKTVIEEISDPITHMIRNSLDHGLEGPEERVKAGKPETGVITLSAEHRGGRIVITIADDGRGINRKAVLSRALERGLISEGAQLSDDEIDNMIFAPGFSTAEQVTDISGRGVGMDVVRRNIQALGGRVSIQSTPGQGSRFTMTLPLTLAVMDGMIVEAGGEKYVIPIPNIVESLRPERDALKRLPNGQKLVRIRGHYIPLCPLYQVFNIPNARKDPAKALVVLVESEEFGTVGIVVDQLIGQQQVVIKSLENNYRPVNGISAATILGNGKVAPILDIEAVYRIAQSSTSFAHDEEEHVFSELDEQHHGIEQVVQATDNATLEQPTAG
ncbi:chemotaxis protein CheA [Sneathiella sp. P13V-1]|uniref:chemotaxis protein CheA n=1 Tax=Sneathiella sp. P13V-1 TaxID=2697366 RepID=UPI00187B26E5|nr:chemotaxis protein CheA [Sneathiella sp. P13V-1]MBE7637711.1 chemotaxis protein CheA [Sneathiella sp. P13V-1]